MKLSKQNLQQPHRHNSTDQERFDQLKATSNLAHASVFHQLNALCVANPSLQNSKRLGIAVSGGSDSLSVLHLAAQWAKLNNYALLALTVDHSLRPAAAEEAEYVKTICGQLKIPHDTLKWHPDPKTKTTQELARQARHFFFAEWTAQNNIHGLILGHTLDDRLETLLMREKSGSGDYGLAAMPSLSPSPIWPQGRHLSLLRPANNLTREELSSVLEESNIAWVCDPSNENTNYERVRVREHLHALSPPQKQALIDRVRFLSATRQRTNLDIKNFCLQHVEWHEDGSVVLQRSELLNASSELQARLVERILLCVSGAKLAVGLNRVDTILRTLNTNQPQSLSAICLGGCWVHAYEDALMICPMPSKRSKTKNAPQHTNIPILANQTITFASRFEVKLHNISSTCNVCTVDEARALGLKPESMSENKKANRTMPVILHKSEETLQTWEPLSKRNFDVQSLHSIRNTNLCSDIFLP